MNFDAIEPGELFIYNGDLFYKKTHVEVHGPNVVRCEDGVHFRVWEDSEIQETQDRKWLIEVLTILEAFNYIELPTYIADWWEKRKVQEQERSLNNRKTKIQNALAKLTKEEQQLLGLS